MVYLIPYFQALLGSNERRIKIMGLFKQKNSPNLWMSFSVNGKQIKRSTGTPDKRLAENILAKVKTQLVENRWFEIDQAKSHTFNEMMEKFMREYAPTKKTSTQERYIYSLKHLDRFFSGLTLADITSSVISDYIEKRKTEGAEAGTINREFAMLSKAFSLAYKRWEWCRENPCSRVQKLPENNQVDRWLNEDEYQNLLKQSAGYLNNQLTDVILIALFTALREGNILNLGWGEVDLFRKVIAIPKEKTKNGKPLTIPMNETVYNILLRKSKVVNMSGYVFSTGNGTKISWRNLIREFDKVVAKAGIQNFTFHCLRHTAATWMIQSGMVDIFTLKEILGHKDIRSTMRYAHHHPESLRKAIKILDNYSIPKKVEKEAVSG